MRISLVFAGVVALAVAPSVVDAQRPSRRQETIEIRGQVPTPQVVTVRPREVPNYDRRILVPNFFDRDFWPSILPPYQLVPSIGTEALGPVDCAPDTVRALTPTAAPGDTATTPSRTPTGSAAPAAAPSTRSARPEGTASASTTDKD